MSQLSNADISLLIEYCSSMQKIECSVDEDELLDSLDRIQQLVLDLVES